MIIAFSGNDGTGKTTYVNYLYKMLTRLNVDCEVVNEFDYFFISPLIKIIRRGKGNPAEYLVGQKKSALYKLWPLLVYIDSLIRYLFLKVWKGDKTIIFDRYACDHLLSFEYLGVSSRLTRKLFLSFPKPNIHFLITADPKTSQKRRSKEKESELYVKTGFYDRQHERYLKLEKLLRQIKIDTSKLTIKAAKALVEKRFLDYFRFKPYRKTKKINKKTIRSILHVKKILGKKTPWILIKTFDSSFKKNPSDLDILVRKEDFISVKKLFMKVAENVRISKIHKAVTFHIKGLLDIDLHYDISWLNKRVLSNRFVWCNQRKVNVSNTNLTLPSKEAQYLILAAHSIFQHHYSKQEEFKFLNSLKPSKLKWGKMKSASKSYGWLDELLMFNNYFNIWYYLRTGKIFDIPFSRDFKIGIKVLRQMCNGVIFHNSKLIFRNNLLQVIDYILTILRRLRFIFTHRLAYD